MSVKTVIETCRFTRKDSAGKTFNLFLFNLFLGTVADVILKDADVNSTKMKMKNSCNAAWKLVWEEGVQLKSLFAVKSPMTSERMAKGNKLILKCSTL